MNEKGNKAAEGWVEERIKTQKGRRCSLLCIILHHLIM